MGLTDGLIAGAAGTTALDAVTYLDMAGRGRSSSSTPEQTVEELAQRAGASIPGEGESRENRVSALGALNGIMVGIGVGGTLGVLRGMGLRPGLAGSTILATVAVMTLSDGVMTGLGVADPSSWSAADWAADVLPHLAYGLVTSVGLLRS